MLQNKSAEIERLRIEGIGYRRIAARLGISENTVKSYLKRNKQKQRSEELLKTCKQCGKVIEQQPHKRKKEFCSDYCRSRWWRKNADLSIGDKAVQKKCPMCNKPFFVYRSEKRSFCSRECYLNYLNSERSCGYGVN